MMKNLAPKCFLLGVILGFTICCLAGYIASTKARLLHFTRFFPSIGPETYYYPTASELLQTVKHNVSRDKILVLIGGSSLLRGTGQNPDELWSEKLQEHLGEKFKVLNFASDGASPSSYGGVLFRMLKNEYPKLIFVAPASPFNPQGRFDGVEPYNYIFWDAYYKKLFPINNQEKIVIRKMQKDDLKTSTGIETHIMNYLDSFFYFKNLWNWISYRLVFTLWIDHSFRVPFCPRCKFQDEVLSPELMKIQKNVNRDKAHLKRDCEYIEGLASQLIMDLSKKSMQIQPTLVSLTQQGYNELFELEDHSKILWIQISYNPTTVVMTANKFQKGYWHIVNESQKTLSSLGYQTLTIGKDFSDDDYLDFAHLRGCGGKKLALQVADKIKIMAKNNWPEN